MSRVVYIDVLKCLAILLVIAGHCIQRSYMAIDINTEAFYGDSVFRFIYASHLPLFIAISGYFFCGTLHRYSFSEILKSRTTRLIIPILAWHVIKMVIDIISGNFDNYSIISIITDFLTDYWFLWAVYFCNLVMLGFNTVFGEKLNVYFLIFPLALILPNSLNISRYVYLFPFFLLGYIVRAKSLTLTKTWASLLAGFSLVVYLFLLRHFSYEHYIYTSGTCLILEGTFSLEQLNVDFFRYMIGFVGVSFFYFVALLLKDIRMPVLLSNIGTQTLGIYIIHMFFTPFISNFDIGVNYLFILGEVVVLTLISYGLTILIDKEKYLRRILLGR